MSNPTSNTTPTPNPTPVDMGALLAQLGDLNRSLESIALELEALVQCRRVIVQELTGRDPFVGHRYTNNTTDVPLDFPDWVNGGDRLR